jgi:hypothetical protein
VAYSAQSALKSLKNDQIKVRLVSQIDTIHENSLF